METEQVEQNVLWTCKNSFRMKHFLHKFESGPALSHALEGRSIKVLALLFPTAQRGILHNCAGMHNINDKRAMLYTYDLLMSFSSVFSFQTDSTFIQLSAASDRE